MTGLTLSCHPTGVKVTLTGGLFFFWAYGQTGNQPSLHGIGAMKRAQNYMGSERAGNALHFLLDEMKTWEVRV